MLDVSVEWLLGPGLNVSRSDPGLRHHVGVPRMVLVAFSRLVAIDWLPDAGLYHQSFFNAIHRDLQSRVNTIPYAFAQSSHTGHQHSCSLWESKYPRRWCVLLHLLAVVELRRPLFEIGVPSLGRELQDNSISGKLALPIRNGLTSMSTRTTFV